MQTPNIDLGTKDRYKNHQKVDRMKDWYFFYDSSGFTKQEIKKLSDNLESLGFVYKKCTELGGAPGAEQIVLWLHSHQYISGILTGVLSNYLYDVLKNINQWLEHNPPKERIIPVVQFFITFKDSKSKRLAAKLSFRFDELPAKNEIDRLVLTQAKYLDISSEEEKQCSKCKEIIHPHTVYYIATERAAAMEPICIFCKDNKPRPS